jgi:hypothetical protein
VKIDVEGFEAYVLQGAREFTKTKKPFYAIDIHVDVDNQIKTTEEECIQILGKLNYSFEKMGHVLLAKPIVG